MKHKLEQGIMRFEKDLQDQIKVRWPTRQQEDQNVVNIGFECNYFKVLQEIQKFMSVLIKGHKVSL